MQLVRLTTWQSTIAQIGARYRFMFATQDRSVAITNATWAEAKRVLQMRTQLRIVSFTPIGRYLQVDFEALASRPLMALQGEMLVAGTPAVTFRAEVVYHIVDAPATSLATRILDAIPTNPATAAGVKAGEQTRAAAEQGGGLGVVVGDQLGALLSGIVNPLIIPAVIGFAAYTLIVRKVR